MNRATLKPKKCRGCGNEFTPARPLQWACSIQCAINIALAAEAKKAAKAKKEERRSLREARERIKTRGEHLAELQAAVNAYVRLRDADDPCISCDRPATWDGQWHASHFKAVGSHPALRFELSNIHKACSICNNWKSGNLGEYRPRLIAKIGLERVEWLEGAHPPMKYTIAQILELKAFYRSEVRRLKKEAA